MTSWPNSAGQPVAVEDIALAGRGDLAALRRLRDYWIAVASGSEINKALPRDMVLPQVELLAEMAAAASGQVEDCVPLLTAYQIHAAALQRDVSASDEPRPDLNERLGSYGSKVASLLSDILSDADVTGAAILVSTLTHQADDGDENAAPLLNFVMDSVTSAQAGAIQTLVRRAERNRTDEV